MSSDTNSPILNFLLMGTGNHVNDWINQFNTVLGLVELYGNGNELGTANFSGTDSSFGGVFGVIDFSSHTGSSTLTLLFASSAGPTRLINNRYSAFGTVKCAHASNPAATVTLHSGLNLIYMDSAFVTYLL